MNKKSLTINNKIDTNLNNNIDDISNKKNKKKINPDTNIIDVIPNCINKNIIENNIIENRLIETNIDTNKNTFLNELFKKQLKNLPINKKLNYNDIKRISKFLPSSIFESDKCCTWTGYITNENKLSKGTYINFYFNKKKIALHRLLYINYVEDVSDNEYIKFTCENKGKCCNINHMKKYNYNINAKTNKKRNIINDLNIQDLNINKKPNDKNEPISINMEKNKLIVEL